MLIIDDSLLINQGTVRSSYHHPDNHRLLIKIPVEEKKKKNFANKTELRGYHSLLMEQVNLDYISHCYGFVHTNLGDGLVCDCILDADGAVSQTIWDRIIYDTEVDIDYIIEIAKEFCNFLMANNVFVFDLNLKNIALSKQKDGKYKPFIIDLKGRHDTKELIPVARYIPFLQRRKLERRCKQLLERIPDFYSRRSELR